MSEYDTYISDSLAHLPDPNVIGIDRLKVRKKYVDLYKKCKTNDGKFFLKYFFDHIKTFDDIRSLQDIVQKHIDTLKTNPNADLNINMKRVPIYYNYNATYLRHHFILEYDADNSHEVGTATSGLPRELYDNVYTHEFNKGYTKAINRLLNQAIQTSEFNSSLRLSQTIGWSGGRISSCRRKKTKRAKLCRSNKRRRQKIKTFRRPRHFSNVSFSKR